MSTMHQIFDIELDEIGLVIDIDPKTKEPIEAYKVINGSATIVYTVIDGVFGEYNKEPDFIDWHISDVVLVDEDAGSSVKINNNNNPDIINQIEIVLRTFHEGYVMDSLD